MQYETEARRARRLARWARQDRQLRSSSPPRLNGGRRLIRIAPEWTVDLPLWESFSDHYLIERGMLPISDDLMDALAEWNSVWERHALEADFPHRERWLTDGLALAARLRTEIHSIAEVRPYIED